MAATTADDDDHNPFVTDVAPNVLRLLKEKRFFEALDDRFSPADGSQEPAKCGHSFEMTRAIVSGCEVNTGRRRPKLKAES
jgi:hypothetical protein